MNVLQSVHLVYFSLPHLNASHGIIVPVSSAAGELVRFTDDNYSEYYCHLLMILPGIVSIPKTAAYGTSKHALHGTANVMDVVCDMVILSFFSRIFQVS